METTNKIGKSLLVYMIIPALVITKNELSYILSTLLGFYLIKKFYKDIKIQTNKPSILDIIKFGFILIGLSTFGSYISVYFNKLWSLFGYTFTTDTLKVFEFKTLYQFIMISIYTLIVAPIIEELIFRGFILESLKKYNTKLAIILSAIIFAIFHMEYYQLLPALLSGLVLGSIYVRYNSIYLVIGAHAINNIISLITIQFNFKYDFIFIIISFILLYKNKFKIEQTKNNEFKYSYIFKSLPCLVFLIFSLLIIFIKFKAI